LLECNFNTTEALQCHYLQATDAAGPRSITAAVDPLSSWTSDECANFIAGLQLYGKDFYLIHQNKVRTRSVAELVHFYYTWKCTDQYAALNNKTFTDRKCEYVTDDSTVVTSSVELFHRDWPISPLPGVRTLLYADAKRRDEHHQFTTFVPHHNSSDMTSTPLTDAGFHQSSPTLSSWLLSPSQLGDYQPSLQQSQTHFDMITAVSESYSNDIYPAPPVGVSSVPQQTLFTSPGATPFMSDNSPLYTGGYTDQFYFSPFRTGLGIAMATSPQGYFNSDNMESGCATARKYCSDDCVGVNNSVYTSSDLPVPFFNNSMLMLSPPVMSGDFCLPTKSTFYCPSPASVVSSFGPFIPHTAGRPYVTSSSSSPDSLTRTDSSSSYTCMSSNEMIAQ
jgi:hypothetical protein